MDRLLAEKSLYEFVRLAWPHIESAEYVDNWHVGAICEHLEAVTSGQIKRLLINIPPGCSKSLLVSVFWPTWEWAINPSIRWFYASYDQKLSTRDSVKCKSLLQSRWFTSLWPNKVLIKPSQDQKTYYETMAGGYRLATSVGGHGTGEHPDRIIVDDPHNVKQAESDLERQNVIDWWDLTMTSRGVSRDARRVIIMQRLNKDDLSGHVLSRKDYVLICLPMRFESNRMGITPLGWTDPRTEEGELLAKKQFTEERVVDLEKNLGPYGIAGQLQQRPAPRGGGMFKQEWFNRRVRASPYQATRIRYWDRAATLDGGCYTAGVLMARDNEGAFFVEHVVHGQWDPDKRNELVVATALRDRARYGPNNTPMIVIEAERGSTGLESFRNLARKLAGFRVREDQPTGSKDTRAEPWADQLAALNVSLVEDGTWDVSGYVDEHIFFRPDPVTKRLGKYKDQVDASSGAFNMLAAGSRREGPIFRVLTVGGPKIKGPRLVVCSEEELRGLQIEERCLLISLGDPDYNKGEEVFLNGNGMVREGGNKGLQYREEAVSLKDPQAERPVEADNLSVSLLGHSCTKVLDSLSLSFVDLSPEERQERWGEPVLPYGRPLAELVMQREHGKKLWAFLLKKRDPGPEVIVFCDNDDRRAASVAYAVADQMRLPRKAHVLRPSDPENKNEGEAPNRHVYQMTITSRAMVM